MLVVLVSNESLMQLDNKKCGVHRPDAPQTAAEACGHVCTVHANVSPPHRSRHTCTEADAVCAAGAGLAKHTVVPARQTQAALSARRYLGHGMQLRVGPPLCQADRCAGSRPSPFTGYREALEELPHVQSLVMAIVGYQCLYPNAGALCFPVHDCGMHDAWTCLPSDCHPQCMPKGLSSPQGRLVSPCRRQAAR